MSLFNKFNQLFFVMMRHKVSKTTMVAPYYSGYSVFYDSDSARRRIRSLKRTRRDWEFRVLPWHSEMSEVDLEEMWRSALNG